MHEISLTIRPDHLDVLRLRVLPKLLASVIIPLSPLVYAKRDLLGQSSNIWNPNSVGERFVTYKYGLDFLVLGS